MFSKIFGLAFAIAFVIVLPLLAGTTETTASTVGTELKGTLVCLGCELNKADGARAACKVYGHKHALKTSDGHYVNFLENQYSDDLINSEKYRDKEITVQGRHFVKANLIDVKSFNVGGKTKSWCGHCGAMDGCGAMKK